MNTSTQTGNYESIQFHREINTLSNIPQKFPLHWHKYVEICTMTRELPERNYPKIRINQTVYTLAHGDSLFIWPGEVHEILKNSEDAIRVIQFMPNLVSDLRDFSPYIHLLRNMHQISHETNPSLAEMIQAYMKQIYDCQSSGHLFSGTEAIITLYKMFIEIGTYAQRQLGGKRTNSEAQRKALQKMQQACSYIADFCEKELTLESVAEYMNFSACYFSRTFKRFTGYHFVEYLTMQRVRRAQALLSDTDLPVTEISFQSGFKSISTFNRVFRQYRGCSPSEFRKYYQG